MEKKIYTSGSWKVKAGKQDEFIREWKNFATWTTNNIDRTGTGHLLRDKTDNTRFLSFGDWENEKIINEWRESQEFKNFSAKMKDLCEDFKVSTLSEVANTREGIAGMSA